MRFRTKQRPRGVLRPSDQRRMMLMIAGFGLILLCFTIVRRPQFWNELFPDDAQPAAEAQPEAAHELISPAGPERSSQIDHDEFISAAPGNADAVTVTARKVPLAEAPGSPTVSYNGIPRVPQELLKPVRDDVIGVHSTEVDAYFAAMKLASKLSPAHLRQAPRGAYALFLDSPAGSRGTAYRIEGQLRQLSIVKGKANAYGVGGTRLYDAWITTPDSGDKLVHVVTMTADRTLGNLIHPKDKDRSVRFMDKNAPKVHFTGYFFKREGYASHQQEGISIAPLFVSGALFEDIQQAVVHTRADEITPYLGWLTFFVSLGILFMVWSFAVSDGAHSNTRAHQLTKLPAVASFDDVTSVTVSEALRDMHVEAAPPIGSMDAFS